MLKDNKRYVNRCKCTVQSCQVYFNCCDYNQAPELLPVKLNFSAHQTPLSLRPPPTPAAGTHHSPLVSEFDFSRYLVLSEILQYLPFVTGYLSVMSCVHLCCSLCRISYFLKDLTNLLCICTVHPSLATWFIRHWPRGSLLTERLGCFYLSVIVTNAAVDMGPY